MLQLRLEKVLARYLPMSIRSIVIRKILPQIGFRWIAEVAVIKDGKIIETFHVRLEWVRSNDKKQYALQIIGPEITDVVIGGPEARSWLRARLSELPPLAPMRKPERFAIRERHRSFSVHSIMHMVVENAEQLVQNKEERVITAFIGSFFVYMLQIESDRQGLESIRQMDKSKKPKLGLN